MEEGLLVATLLVVMLIFAITTEINSYLQSFNVLLSFEKDFENIKLPVVKLKSGNAVLNFLVDSGAQASYIDENVLDLINVSKVPETEGIVIGINNTSCKTGLCNVVLQNENHIMEFQMQTFDFKKVICNDEDLTGGITIAGLLGSDFLQKHKGVIDYKHKLVKLCPKS